MVNVVVHMQAPRIVVQAYKVLMFLKFHVHVCIIDSTRAIVIKENGRGRERESLRERVRERESERERVGERERGREREREREWEGEREREGEREKEREGGRE